MMKDVTILTFDEMERIRQDIDDMMDAVQSGANDEFEAKYVCIWVVKKLIEFRKQFE